MDLPLRLISKNTQNTTSQTEYLFDQLKPSWKLDISLVWVEVIRAVSDKVAPVSRGCPISHYLCNRPSTIPRCGSILWWTWLILCWALLLTRGWTHFWFFVDEQIFLTPYHTPQNPEIWGRKIETLFGDLRPSFMQGVMAWLYQHESYIYPNQASRKIKNNSERPVDALDVKKMNDWLTHNLKSRDASASKKYSLTGKTSKTRISKI